MDAMELLLGRTSAVQLAEPAPNDEAIEKIIQSAVYAPDHGRLRPWKFILIRGDMRRVLGEVMADSLKRKQPDSPPEILNRERAKAMRAPLIVVVAHTPRASKIPAIEQMLSTAAAAQNIMLAAYALGYGAMWKTGDAAYDEEVKHTLGLATPDSIVGFIYVGTCPASVKTLPSRARAVAKDHMVEWAPSAASARCE